jgi:hypothetical protein
LELVKNPQNRQFIFGMMKIAEIGHDPWPISAGNSFHLATITPFSCFLAIITPLSRHERIHQTRMARTIPTAAGTGGAGL